METIFWIVFGILGWAILLSQGGIVLIGPALAVAGVMSLAGATKHGGKYMYWFAGASILSVVLLATLATFQLAILSLIGWVIGFAIS